MTFEELNKKIAEQQIGVARITDVKPGEYKLDIINPTDPKDKVRVLLVDLKSGKKFSTSIAGLASMRIVTKLDDAVKATTTLQVRETEGYDNLQNAMAKDSIVLSPSTKFTAVHNLTIVDRETEKPIYKNECYSDYGKYVKETRKIALGPDGDEKNLAFATAGEKLRESGVAAKYRDNADWHLKMPVFIVS